MTVAFTTLPGLPASVAAARRFVTGVLHACPETTAPDDMVDRAALLTSELAPNAIRYTRSGDPGYTFTVHLTVDACGLRTEIHTRVPRQWQTFPHIAAPTDPFAEHGRGLLLVDQLATTWGTLAPWQHGVYFHLTWTTNPPNHTT